MADTTASPMLAYELPTSGDHADLRRRALQFAAIYGVALAAHRSLASLLFRPLFDPRRSVQYNIRYNTGPFACSVLAAACGLMIAVAAIAILRGRWPMRRWLVAALIAAGSVGLTRYAIDVGEIRWVPFDLTYHARELGLELLVSAPLALVLLLRSRLLNNHLWSTLRAVLMLAISGSALVGIAETYEWIAGWAEIRKGLSPFSLDNVISIYTAIMSSMFAVVGLITGTGGLFCVIKRRSVRPVELAFWSTLTVALGVSLAAAALMLLGDFLSSSPATLRGTLRMPTWIVALNLEVLGSFWLGLAMLRALRRQAGDGATVG